MTKQTLKDLIESLPEVERVARKAMFSEWEWEHDWRLHAWPHQVPHREGWRYWSIIGPPGTGATAAGEMWLLDKLINVTPNTQYLALPGNDRVGQVADSLFESLNTYAQAQGTPYPTRKWSKGGGEIRIDFPWLSSALTIMDTDPNRLRGLNPQYVWVERAQDANAYTSLFPRVKQMVFSGPIKMATGPDAIYTNGTAIL